LEVLKVPKSSKASFLIEYLNSCFITDSINCINANTNDDVKYKVIRSELDILSEELISSKLAKESDFSVCKVCHGLAIITSKNENSTLKHHHHHHQQPLQQQANYLQENLFNKFESFNIHEINAIIKFLGKLKLIPEIFKVFDYLRKEKNEGGRVVKGVQANNETFEILANALVASVDEEKTCISMKELPKPNMSIPEVYFHIYLFYF
jgi:hypothetical protein